MARTRCAGRAHPCLTTLKAIPMAQHLIVIGGGSAGWTPYGWNGLGWAYGWGYGWGYWGGSYSTLCGYTLSGKLLTDGSDNVFTQSEFTSNVVDEDSPENWNLPKYWPATVTLSRIPKTGVLS